MHARLGLCFLGEIGAVGIQELAGHGRRFWGWIEARGKKRVASSSSAVGSRFAGASRWRVGTATGSADLCNWTRRINLFCDLFISEAL